MLKCAPHTKTRMQRQWLIAESTIDRSNAITDRLDVF